ncbi:MAG: 50S ribosomal protein L21 [Candidatus Omnitrophota bacterium]|nr:MAG: 50S ribosomal protein L21 [Candidatus Omnitrophota bacterium]
MYVIVETGGRQYKLEKNDEFLLNRIAGKEGGVVKFKHILFAKEKNAYHAGKPYIKDAYVTCEILSHPRGKKVFAFKYKRRKSKKRKVGHKQDLTRLKVKEIHI